MIRAYRIPAPSVPKEIVECHRCGIAWRDYRFKWLPGAPCADCREQLLEDGVDVTEWMRPKYRPQVAA